MPFESGITFDPRMHAPDGRGQGASPKDDKLSQGQSGEGEIIPGAPEGADQVGSSPVDQESPQELSDQERAQALAQKIDDLEHLDPVEFSEALVAIFQEYDPAEWVIHVRRLEKLIRGGLGRYEDQITALTNSQSRDFRDLLEVALAQIVEELDERDEEEFTRRLLETLLDRISSQQGATVQPEGSPAPQEVHDGEIRRSLDAINDGIDAISSSEDFIQATNALLGYIEDLDRVRAQMRDVIARRGKLRDEHADRIGPIQEKILEKVLILFKQSRNNIDATLQQVSDNLKVHEQGLALDEQTRADLTDSLAQINQQIEAVSQKLETSQRIFTQRGERAEEYHKLEKDLESSINRLNELRLRLWKLALPLEVDELNPNNLSSLLSLVKYLQGVDAFDPDIYPITFRGRKLTANELLQELDHRVGNARKLALQTAPIQPEMGDFTIYKQYVNDLLREAREQRDAVQMAIEIIQVQKGANQQPAKTPEVREHQPQAQPQELLNRDSIEKVLSDIESLVSDEVMESSRDLIARVDLSIDQNHLPTPVLSASELDEAKNAFSQEILPIYEKLRSSGYDAAVELLMREDVLLRYADILDVVKLKERAELLSKRIKEFKNLRSDIEFSLWAQGIKRNTSELDLAKSGGYQALVDGLAGVDLSQKSAVERSNIKLEIDQAIGRVIAESGAISERQVEFLKNSYLCQGYEILDEIQQLEDRDNLTRLEEEERQRLTQQLNESFADLDTDLDHLVGSDFEKTREEDQVEEAYARLYEKLDGFREKAGSLPDFKIIEMKIHEAKLRSSLRSALLGMANIEITNEDAGVLGDWDRGARKMLESSTKLLLQEIKRSQGYLSSINSTLQTGVDVARLEQVRSEVMENIDNRMVVHLSWTSSQKALEGDGQVVQPPGGLTLSNFPFKGTHFSYFVKEGRQSRFDHTEEMHWFFNPVVRDREYAIPNFFDNRRGEFISGSYEQTLIDYFLEILDEVYAGERDDAKYLGKVISFRNFHIAKGELINYLISQAKVQMGQRVSSNPLLDRFINPSHEDHQKAERELMVMALLAYKISLMGTCNHTYLARGSNEGQGAKLWYDMHPEFFINYLKDATLQAHIFPFFLIFGFESFDPIEEFFEELGYRGKMPKTRIALFQSKLDLLKADTENAADRFVAYGSPDYEWLLQPLTTLVDVERGFEIDANRQRKRDAQNNYKPTKSRFALAPSVLRQRGIKVKDKKVDLGGTMTHPIDSNLPIEQLFSDENGGVLRFHATGSNLGKPRKPGDGKIVTFDDLQDIDGSRLYGLMPLHQIGDLTDFYNNWANNLRRFMDEFIFASKEAFVSKMEDIEGLADYKRNTKYITPNMPNIGAEAKEDQKLADEIEGQAVEASFSEVIKNRIICKLVLAACIIKFTEMNASNYDIGKYLDEARERGILGPGRIGEETREAIYRISTSGGGMTRFINEGVQRLATELENLNKFSR